MKHNLNAKVQSIATDYSQMSEESNRTFSLRRIEETVSPAGAPSKNREREFSRTKGNVKDYLDIRKEGRKQ